MVMVGVTAGYVIAVRALIHFLRVDTQAKPVKFSKFSQAFRVLLAQCYNQPSR